jgi:hypothetical protein
MYTDLPGGQTITMFITSDSEAEVTIPGPPAGRYTIDELVTQLNIAFTDGLGGEGSLDFGIQVSLEGDRLFWIMEPDDGFVKKVVFDDRDALVRTIGFAGDEFSRTLHSEAHYGYGGASSYPVQEFGSFHELTVPSTNYTLTELVEALNAVVPPYPTILTPSWSIIGDDRVFVGSGSSFSLRVVSVIENRHSSLAPLIGFHGSAANSFYVAGQLSDSQSGLSGLTDAYLHIRPIATGLGLAISSSDHQSLQVSVFGKIPCDDVNYGEFVQHDFSRSGESFKIEFEDGRDLSRLQVRLRDHQGNLIPLTHPGITLFLRVFVR